MTCTNVLISIDYGILQITLDDWSKYGLPNVEQIVKVFLSINSNWKLIKQHFTNFWQGSNETSQNILVIKSLIFKSQNFIIWKPRT